MDKRFLALVFMLLGVTALGVGAYGFVADWLADPTPALALETTELDLGQVVIGQPRAVEVELRNQGSRDLRVLGECFS